VFALNELEDPDDEESLFSKQSKSHQSFLENKDIVIDTDLY
jgi:hypothetical protein